MTSTTTQAMENRAQWNEHFCRAETLQTFMQAGQPTVLMLWRRRTGKFDVVEVDRKAKEEEDFWHET